MLINIQKYLNFYLIKDFFCKITKVEKKSLFIAKNKQTGNRKMSMFQNDLTIKEIYHYGTYFILGLTFAFYCYLMLITSFSNNVEYYVQSIDMLKLGNTFICAVIFIFILLVVFLYGFLTPRKDISNVISPFFVINILLLFCFFYQSHRISSLLSSQQQKIKYSEQTLTIEDVVESQSVMYNLSFAQIIIIVCIFAFFKISIERQISLAENKPLENLTIYSNDNPLVIMDKINKNPEWKKCMNEDWEKYLQHVDSQYKQSWALPTSHFWKKHLYTKFTKPECQT
jgi:hypothetical protein